MSPLLRALPLCLTLAACGSVDPAPPAPTCDEACRDGVAMRATREMMKLMYNLTLQGKPVGGDKDVSFPCPGGGTARLTGSGTSNAEVGATEVDLTYEFSRCAYSQTDSEAAENYDLIVTGVISQKGTLSAQSSATTAVVMKCDKLTLEGTVFDPAQAYTATDCAFDMTQNGNQVSGHICDRKAGFSF